MWRALALRMGYPLRILKRLMTRREFEGWCRFYDRQPFDDERCYDLPAAVLQNRILNVVDPQGAAERRPTDFLPFRYRDPDQELDEKILRVL